MPTVLLRFPGGRYHATPWGHHVNEGQIEWPPSPWRLLRALIATGYATQHWDEVPQAGRRLIETLASALPIYQLPSASAAHSRHYMPTGKLDKGMEKTTLVFDTWANVGNGQVIVRWDCDLDGESTELFASLVEKLGYLGRSESWVEAKVISDDLPLDAKRTAFPRSSNDNPGADSEQIPLMAATTPETYSDWRKERTEKLLADLPLPEGKKKPTKALLKKRDAVVAPYPEDLLECLQKDTAWWKKQHQWSQPPGSQRVLYWWRTDTLVVSTSPVRQRPTARPVTTMLLSLTTPSGNKSALPPVQRTLPQAELFHRAIVGRVRKEDRVDCSELTGKNEHGQPLRNGHQHAHVLPLDLDNDGHLDHILIHASMGLGDAAQQAIRTMKRTWTKGGVGDLQVALVGRGDLDCLRQLPVPLSPRIEKLLGPDGGSRIWTSATPFVAPRYLKRKGRNDLAGQVNAELESRGLPKTTDVEMLPWYPDTLKLRHFVRVRWHGGQPPPDDTGYVLRIHISKPIVGPLTLGYASHFGLGLFFASIGNAGSKATCDAFLS